MVSTPAGRSNATQASTTKTQPSLSMKKLLLCTLIATPAFAISISQFNVAYTENFNTLASSSTSSTLPAGWSLAESGTGANTTFTAGTGSGIVTPTVGVYTYTHGQLATLTASANTGSTFSGWSGDCSGTGNCAVSMIANHMVTATFDVRRYQIYGSLIVK